MALRPLATTVARNGNRKGGRQLSESSLHRAVIDGPGVRGLARQLNLHPSAVSRSARGKRTNPHTLAMIICALKREEAVLLELQHKTAVLNRVLDEHRQGRVTAEAVLDALHEQQESAQLARAVLERQMQLDRQAKAAEA